MYSFYLLSRKDLNNDLVNNAAFFVCSLYMTSNILFLLALSTLVAINISNKFKYSALVILIALSLINSTYEVLQEQVYIVDLSECKKDITSNRCFEYLMSIQNK